MSLELLEAAITDLSTYLQAGMAAKVIALNAEYDDSVTLTDIAKWYEGNLPTAQPEYPSVCLQGLSWRPEEQTATELFIKNFINVLVFVGDDNDQDRFKRLCRYARGIVELVAEGESSYGYLSKLEGDIVVSDTLNAPPFLQAVVIPISLYPLSGETY